MLPQRPDTEGPPLVVAEAIATGVLVVTARNGGTEEVVEEGKIGILVERHSPNQLAEAIRSLVTSRSTRVSMGKAGRQRVEQFFDLTKQAAELEENLETVAKSHNRS